MRVPVLVIDIELFMKGTPLLVQHKGFVTLNPAKEAPTWCAGAPWVSWLAPRLRLLADGCHSAGIPQRPPGLRRCGLQGLLLKDSLCFGCCFPSLSIYIFIYMYGYISMHIYIYTYIYIYIYIYTYIYMYLYVYDREYCHVFQYVCIRM